MKDSEELIEKVLAGLRNADPCPGMEHRILAAVQDHASAQSRLGWRRFIPLWLAPVATHPVACGVALAGIFAFALAIPAIHRYGRVPTQSTKDSAPLAALPQASSEVAAEDTPLPEPRSSVRPRVKVNTRRIELARADDSLAMREMLAPSHPAPPLPLTEQEKLLLRMVRMRSPEELAVLDPVKWVAQDAKEKADFDKFFGPSTKRGNE